MFCTLLRLEEGPLNSLKGLLRLSLSRTLHVLSVPRCVPKRAPTPFPIKSPDATGDLHASPENPHTAGRGASALASPRGPSGAEGGAGGPPPYVRGLGTAPSPRRRPPHSAHARRLSL